MSRLRGFLLGVALALPLAATGGTQDVSIIETSIASTVGVPGAESVGVPGTAPAAGKSTMTSVVSGPASERCCWVFFLGMWICYVC